MRVDKSSYTKWYKKTIDIIPSRVLRVAFLALVIFIMLPSGILLYLLGAVDTFCSELSADFQRSIKYLKDAWHWNDGDSN